MIEKIYVIKTSDTNPYHNLALEEHLLNTVKSNECILYLWQNRRTVVIGRNQNALNECRVQALESDGGFLARRLSGGGAVYHDLGNLNFTFLVRAEDFNKEKQTDVILKAVQLAGISAEKNGRNDLTVDGRKFSGHAYYKTKEQCYHHGTVMLFVETEPLSRYLNVSPLKLKAKGVESVKSRVLNLCEKKPELTVDDMADYLVKAFGDVYKLPVNYLLEKDLDGEFIKEAAERIGSPQWKYGGMKVLENSVEARFSWGQVRLDYDVEKSTDADRPPILKEVCFSTDGLDADYLFEVKERLTLCPIEKNELLKRLTQNTASRGFNTAEIKSMAEDIISLLIHTEAKNEI